MSGYRLMSQLLDANLWSISDACPKLIECLPTLIRDEDDQETVLKVDYAEGDTIGDDPAETLRGWACRTSSVMRSFPSQWQPIGESQRTQNLAASPLRIWI
jgi:hypothetical protein